ncbi:uncharacterized protein LOC112466669 [Temnothorax curvispinosus]|uniref:Uncharacterized protein LOC112466669 n=1 Tax=Temnothorax curvispinosus TaxID=300111 RepID=A0A6J1RCQ1_9HYME|nr:uncharacterized protein LOC112466669 [Temnothorax curvispinosus]
MSTSGEEFPLDIDDEQDLLDFKTRSLNVNFKDPNELWSALFEEEIQEFELLIKIKKTERRNIRVFVKIIFYYIGYYLKCIQETARVFVTICENMRNNKIFKDTDEAIESVIEYVKASTSILQKSGVEMKPIYTSAAFSELHRLLAAAKKQIITCKSDNQKFKKRFL